MRPISILNSNDDFSIYVLSQKAGERVKESISTYITDKLKLKVNEQKSVVCDAWIRWKLRCFRIKLTKRVIDLVIFLKKQRVVTYQSWIIALSGVGCGES